MSMTPNNGPIKIPVETGENNAIRPEFFRLPRRGQDPYFGLTRGYYYGEDKAGRLILLRLRKPGTKRGVTLIPYLQVAALLRAEQEEQGAKGGQRSKRPAAVCRKRSTLRSSDRNLPLAQRGKRADTEI